MKVTAQEIVAALLEAGDASFKKEVTLQYRPFLQGDDWRWFWVLLPENRDKALASGEAGSRAEAATAARLMARQLHVYVSTIDVLKPALE